MSGKRDRQRQSHIQRDRQTETDRDTERDTDREREKGRERERFSLRKTDTGRRIEKLSKLNRIFSTLYFSLQALVHKLFPREIESVTKKDQGNKAFAKGQFQESINCYTEALALCKFLYLSVL